MGQYQEWRHYREIDQLLHTQLATLETELAQLDERIHVLEQDHSYPENVIIRTLLQQRAITHAVAENGHSLLETLANSSTSAAQTATPPESPTPPPPSAPQEQTLPTISPSLFAWGNLPNFDTQQIHEPATSEQDSPAQASDPAAHLLPANVNAFMDSHSQTMPQMKIPWWLLTPQHPANTATEGQSNPIDQQTIRTNQLVERWFKRWGHTVDETQDAHEGQKQ